jgi:hypothetical protein
MLSRTSGNSSFNKERKIGRSCSMVASCQKSEVKIDQLSWTANSCLQQTLETMFITNSTFPNTGAIPIMTEAKAERTCWDESDDNSCKCSWHELVF